jgi:hypothetical protein
MSAFETFRALRTEKSFWVKQTDRMVWLAARYYAGVDSLDDLERLAQPMPVSGNFCIDPVLTYGQVRTIVSLR